MEPGIGSEAAVKGRVGKKRKGYANPRDVTI